MNKLKIGELEDPRRVVFIGCAPKLHRQYYDTPFNSNKPKAPTCWSSDSKAPDMTVKNKQAKFCTLCDHNVKGSGAGLSKACKVHMKTAVCKGSALKHGPIQQLIISSYSLFSKGSDMGFKQYTNMLKTQGLSINSVLTKIKLIDDNGYPRVAFSPLSHLPREELDCVLERAKSNEVIECLNFAVGSVIVQGKSMSDMQKLMGMSE